MKRLDVFVPTRNRLAKVRRMLASLPSREQLAALGVELRVSVICDADPMTAKTLADDPNVDYIMLLTEQHGSVAARNLFTRTVEDALLYATDDIEFEPGAIETAIEAMRARFTDDDGVIGFNQSNAHKFSKAGVALVGQPFLARYPGKKLFYPGYWHFSCQEIERAAIQLGKFFFCPEARLHHHHPSYERDERDSTHREARSKRDNDRRLSKHRLAKGLTWGLK